MPAQADRPILPQGGHNPPVVRAPSCVEGHRGDYAWVAGLWVVLVAFQVWWIASDTRPPEGDPATHLRRALGYAQAMESASPGTLVYLWTRAEYGMYTYPPLVHVLTGGFIAVGLDPTRAAVVANALFLWMLLLGVMRIGRVAWGQAGGIAAAGLAGVMMGLATLMRHAYLDFPLAALIAWCCWQLVRTRGLECRRASVWLGVWAGLAMLAKPMAAIFLVGPGLWTLWRAGIPWRNWPRWRNGAIAVGTMVAVAGSWYAFHLPLMLAIAHYNQAVAPVIEGDPTPWTLAGATYYLHLMTFMHAGLPLMATAAVALGVGVGRGIVCQRRVADPVRRDARALVLWWLIAGYVLISVAVVNKDERYGVPLLPALALLIGSLASQERRWHRAVAIAGLALCALPYYARAMTSHPGGGFDLSLGEGMPVWGAQFDGGPRREDWRIVQIVRDMQARSPRAGPQRPIRLAAVPFLDRFCIPDLLLAADLMRVFLNSRAVGNDAPDLDAIRRLYDFVLVKTGDQGIHHATTQARLWNHLVQARPDVFWTVAVHALPDGSEARLYSVRQ
jgi:4-amino-4-deoxy-L-arabinose transferase-like glycosyltransferase